MSNRKRNMVYRPVVSNQNPNPMCGKGPGYVQKAFDSSSENQFNFLHWNRDETRSRQRKDLDFNLLNRIFPRLSQLLDRIAPWNNQNAMYGDSAKGVDYFAGVDMQSLVHDILALNFSKLENVINLRTTSTQQEQRTQAMINCLRKKVWDHYEYKISEEHSRLGRNKKVQKFLNVHGNQRNHKLRYFKFELVKKQYLYNRVMSQLNYQSQQRFASAPGNSMIEMRGRNYAAWRPSVQRAAPPRHELFSRMEIQQQDTTQRMINSMGRIPKRKHRPRRPSNNIPTAPGGGGYYQRRGGYVM